jgi:hypothetical protein
VVERTWDFMQRNEAESFSGDIITGLL